MNIQAFMGDKNEKPLDNIVTNGGFFGIFRTVGCVGDSLSSGEFESVNEKGEKSYHDMFDYSWGQYIAREAGCKVYNFSKGGMTAKAYCEEFAEEKGFWDEDKACQAYIIALGVNDLFGKNQEIGTVQDICMEDYTKNKDTFAGWYGRIIQRLKKISPDARFFFMTMMNEGRDNEREAKRKAHAELLRNMAEVFKNSYVIDFYRYAPVYDDEFKDRFYLHTHLNPMGYMLTAKMVMSYVDYIIRHNYNDFKKTGFIGTDIETGI